MTKAGTNNEGSTEVDFSEKTLKGDWEWHVKLGQYMKLFGK